jgi:hypothetical protein
MDNLTPRSVAKYVVEGYVAHRVGKTASNMISDYTRFDSDDFVVEMGSDVFGMIVANRVKPLTDRVVDKTADFIVAKREARRSKKDKPKTKK